jgi:hypothetical protein
VTHCGVCSHCPIKILLGIKGGFYRMAKKDFSISFTNCTISLEDNEIVEYPKKKDDDIKTYVLSEVLEELKGENRRFNISIKETVELEPKEIG